MINRSSGLYSQRIIIQRDSRRISFTILLYRCSPMQLLVDAVVRCSSPMQSLVDAIVRCSPMQLLVMQCHATLSYPWPDAWISVIRLEINTDHGNAWICHVNSKYSWSVCKQTLKRNRRFDTGEVFKPVRYGNARYLCSPLLYRFTPFAQT